MKKILFAAIAVMVLFASCDKGNEVNDLYTGETKSVFMKLEQSSGLRAVTDGVSDETVEFSSGYMYFVDALGDITKRFTLSSGDTDGNNLKISDLASGISGIIVPEPSRKVYVIANVPSGVTLPNGGSYSGVEKVIITAASQAGSIDAGAIKGVILYSETPGTLSESTPGAGDWSAKVAPKQIANRLEITDIKAKANGGLDGFTVVGIYVNYLYDEKEIGTAASSLVNNGSDELKYVAGQSLYTTAGVFYDEPNAEDVNLTVAAGTGKVWGYNLLAGAETPHIVIKLTNIQVSDTHIAPSYITDLSSVAYVTVKGFVNNGSAIKFEDGGQIFTVPAGALQFELKDITPEPEIQTINAEVEVKLTDWTIVPVTPVI